MKHALGRFAPGGDDRPWPTLPQDPDGEPSRWVVILDGTSKGGKKKGGKK